MTEQGTCRMSELEEAGWDIKSFNWPVSVETITTDFEQPHHFESAVIQPEDFVCICDPIHGCDHDSLLQESIARYGELWKKLAGT